PSTSAVNVHRSAFSFQLSTLDFQLSAFNSQLSTFNFQLSALNYQLSTVNCPLTQSHVQRHHNNKSAYKSQGSQIGVFILLCFGDHFFDHYKDHGTCSKAQSIR